MSRHVMPGVHPLLPLLLAAIACQDPTDPRVGMQPRSAQGSLATWTVNSLADPGNGVCDDTECTLREAIDAAASGDRIEFASGLQGDIQLAAGALRIAEKSLTIDGSGRIAVDAQGNSRVIGVTGTDVLEPTVSLAGLIFKNGFASLNDGAGAGIYAAQVALTLDAVRVSNSVTGADGGGIALIEVEATIRNSVISENQAENRGGGIFSDFSTLSLVNTTVDHNQAQSAAGLGGGIHTRGVLTVTSSTISNNQAGAYGGGVFVSSGEATVQSTTISGNSAVIGAGVVNGSPEGPSPAGGILSIRSSTIAANTATTHTGGVLHGGSGGNRTTLANTVVASNQGNGCGAPSGGFSSLGHNLGVGCAVHFTADGDVNVLPTQVFTEVLQPDLADNGGPTKTHALIARGRAADAGYCPGETADQRGFARPVDDPVMPNALDACDIGAYELQGPVATVADLMISQAVNKTSVKQGELLTYLIRVQNLGPEAAPDVVVSNVLSSGVTFVEARHNKGTHTAPPSGETGTVTWSLGDLLDQANEVAEITVTVRVKGRTTITNTASVTGAVADPNEANNSAAIRVSVASGSGGKGGGKK